MVAPALIIGGVTSITQGLLDIGTSQPPAPPLDFASVFGQVQELNVRARGLPGGTRGAITRDPFTGEVIVTTVGALESGVTDLILSQQFSRRLGIPLFPPNIPGPTRDELGLTRESLLGPGFEVVPTPNGDTVPSLPFGPSIDVQAAAVRTLRPAATRPLEPLLGGPCAGVTTARGRALCIDQGGSF